MEAVFSESQLNINNNWICRINLVFIHRTNNNNINNNNNNDNNNNLEKFYTEKEAQHEPSGWVMFTKCSVDQKENKLDYCRREDG